MGFDYEGNLFYDINYQHLRWGYRKSKTMDTSNDKTLVNFRKAKSHIDKIIKMIESGDYCVDIMQQNLAVIGLLKSAHQMLMEGHLNTCFANAMKSSNEKRKQEMIQEILKVSRIANK